MPSIPALSSIVSWRTLALLFALLNLKCLPLAWHVRLFYRLYQSWYSRSRVERALREWRSRPSSKATYVLFEPVSITTRSPLLETDYNLHKSNSTYFADLDESRTALVTKFLVPGMKQGSIELEKEGHHGRLAVILGSVHTTFHREIKPYELYEVRSKLLGWDQKWVIIGSWFVRPGKKETLLASALSKYVVKKGKFTVHPERCLVTAGWIPARPDGVEATLLQVPGREGMSTLSEEPSIVPTPQEGVEAAIPTSLSSVTDNLVQRLESVRGKTATTGSAHLEGAGGEWDWHRIERERLRGLQIAANWLALDKTLMDEFVNDSGAK